MASNLHSDSNGCNSFNYFQNMDSHDVDSLFEGLKRQSSVSKENTSSKESLGLPKPGKHLESLLANVSSIGTTSPQPPVPQSSRGIEEKTTEWEQIFAQISSLPKVPDRLKALEESEISLKSVAKATLVTPPVPEREIPVESVQNTPFEVKNQPNQKFIFEQAVKSESSNSAPEIASHQNKPEMKPEVELQVEPKVELEAEPKVELEAEPKVELEAEPKVELEAEPKVELEAESIAYSSKTESQSSSNHKLLWFSLESSAGLLVGLGIIIVLMNLRNPLEKRVIREFQQSIPATVSFESSEKDAGTFSGSELVLENLQTEFPSENQSMNFSVQKMDLTISPLSRVFRNISVHKTGMEGVFFPNIRTLSFQNDWRPAPLAPLFSEEIKNILAQQQDSLESIRYLNTIKEQYLPAYEAISKKITEINTESERLQSQLKEMPEFQTGAELTPELLRTVNLQHPELLPTLEQFGKLRQEALGIQKQWMDLNQSVASDLTQIREKIALDAKAFSSILHYTTPNEQNLTEFLFRTQIEKCLAESLDWGKAVTQMAEMGLLAGSRYKAPQMTASGIIELFGQNFSFDSSWESNIEPECVSSYRGNLRLYSEAFPEEMLKDAFVVIACSEKPDRNLRTISARIPLINDSFVWGDYASLPLYAHAQDSSLVMDLTLFGDEIRGKISLEMHQVSFDAPTKDADFPGILFSQFEGKILPKVLISAEISGSQQKPVVKCDSSVTPELIPLWTVALQQIHQKARKEIIAAIYERLKNAETSFNGLLEPYYQEVMTCTEKTDLFRNFSVEAIHEAQVEITPMNLAHLEVNQIDLSENIPTYNPNLGLEPTSAMEETVSSPIGSQVPAAQVPASIPAQTSAPVPAAPVVKSLPVKKVSKIEPIPEESANKKQAVQVPVTIKPMTAEPTTAEPTTAESATELPMEQETPVEPEKPMPNVADPVLYSNQNSTSHQPMDVPAKKKSSMPLPMGKATSKFGS